jgi:hypothetical protein
VREELGIESHFKLMMGLSFGYVDHGDSANNLRTDRAPLEQSTTFHN